MSKIDTPYYFPHANLKNHTHLGGMQLPPEASPLYEIPYILMLFVEFIR